MHKASRNTVQTSKGVYDIDKTRNKIGDWGQGGGDGVQTTGVLLHLGGLLVAVGLPPGAGHVEAVLPHLLSHNPSSPHKVLLPSSTV